MTSAARYRFAGVELDVGRRQLRRGDELVSLQNKPLALLVHLIEHRQRAVSKDEIFRQVWPDEFVTDSSLAVCITKIRKALGESAGAQSTIQTVHGFGYRFVAEVEELSLGAASTNDGAPGSHVVGREAELASLHATWQRAVAGERVVALVCGDAGIGKTSLVQTFAARLAETTEDAWILHGDCLDLRAGTEPFLPLIDALTQACRGPYAADAIEVLREHASPWLLQLPGVLKPEQRRLLRDEVRDVLPGRLLRMLGDAVTALAAQRPLLLVIEDLHWADPTTLDVLTRIARERGPAPILILGTLRPEFSTSERRPLYDFVDGMARRPTTVEISLDGLSREAVVSFVERSSPRLQATPELCHRLFERTGGHPLFLRTAADHLENGGDLDTVPPDLHRTIDLDIATRPLAEQHLIEAAAVVGQEVVAALVAAAVEAPLADVEDALLAITRQTRWIEALETEAWPDGSISRRFRFRHAYHVEVALGRASPSRQRQWHGRIAERLRHAFGDAATGPIVMRMARHYAAAGDIEAALSCCHRALAEAHESYSHERIVATAQTALGLLAQLPPSAARDRRELALRLALTPALIAARGYVFPPLQETCERVLDITANLGEPWPQFFSLVTLSAIHQTRGAGPAARACAENLVALAEATLPPLAQTLARGRLGQILASDGELERARAHLEAAVAVADDDGIMRLLGSAVWVDPGVVMLGYLGNVVLVQGFVDSGVALVREAVARAERIDRRVSLATAHLLSVCTHALLRDAAATYASCTAFVEMSMREGLMDVREQGLLATLAQLTHPSTQVGAAAAAFNAMLDDHERRGILHAMPLLRCIEAEAHLQRGDREHATTALDAAEQRIAAGGERVFLPEVQRLRGDVAATSGNHPDAAEVHYLQAIESARSLGARWFELRATVAWARLLQRLGRAPEARANLASLHAWFVEGHDSPDLRAAAQLLAEFE